jgi:hypothetical protein
MAIAPTAAMAIASGPIADGPRMRAPTAIAPVTLGMVCLLWPFIGCGKQPLRVFVQVRKPPTIRAPTVAAAFA